MLTKSYKSSKKLNYQFLNKVISWQMALKVRDKKNNLDNGCWVEETQTIMF